MSLGGLSPDERVVGELTTKLKQLEGKYTEFVTYCARLLRSHENLVRRLNSGDLSSSESHIDLVELNKERTAVERELRALMSGAKLEPSPKLDEAFTAARDKVCTLLPPKHESRKLVNEIFAKLAVALQQSDSWKSKFKELENEKETLEAQHRQRLQHRSLKWQTKCREVQTELSRTVKENTQLQAHLEAHQSCSQIMHEQQQILLRQSKQLESLSELKPVEALRYNSARRSPVLLKSPRVLLGSPVVRSASSQNYRRDEDIQRKLEAAENEKVKLENALQVVKKRLETAGWHLSRLLKFCSEGFKYVNREAKTNIDRERQELEEVLGVFERPLSPEFSPIESVHVSQLSNTEQSSFVKSIEKEKRHLQQELITEKTTRASLEALVARKQHEIEMLCAELLNTHRTRRKDNRLKTLVQDCSELNLEKKELEEQLKVFELEVGLLEEKFKTELMANERLNLQKNAAETRALDLEEQLRLATELGERLSTDADKARRYFEQQVLQLTQAFEDKCASLLTNIDAKEQSLNRVKEELFGALTQLIEAAKTTSSEAGLRGEIEYIQGLLDDTEKWGKERETELLIAIKTQESELGELRAARPRDEWLREKESLVTKLEIAELQVKDLSLTLKASYREIDELKSRVEMLLETEAQLKGHLGVQQESLLELQADFNSQLEEADLRYDRLHVESKQQSSMLSELEGLAEVLKEREKQLDVVLSENYELVEKVKELDRQRNSLSTDESPIKLQALESQLAEAHRKLAKVSRKKQQLQEAVSQAKTLEATLTEQNRQLTEMLNTSLLQFEGEKTKRQSFDADLNSLEAELKTLSQVVQDKEGRVRELEAELKSKDERILEGVEANFKRICEELDLSEAWQRDLSDLLCRVRSNEKTLDTLKTLMNLASEASCEELIEHLTELKAALLRTEAQLSTESDLLSAAHEELATVKHYNDEFAEKYKVSSERLISSEKDKIALESEKTALSDQLEERHSKISQLEVTLEEVKQSYSLEAAELMDAVDATLEHNKNLQEEKQELLEKIEDILCQAQARQALLTADLLHWSSAPRHQTQPDMRDEVLMEELRSLQQQFSQLAAARQVEVQSLKQQAEHLNELQTAHHQITRQLHDQNKELLLSKAMLSDVTKKAEERQKDLEETMKMSSAEERQIVDWSSRFSSIAETMKKLGNR
jgi:chromosome segregation ATPase